MSSNKLRYNTNTVSIDERIHVLCTKEVINGKEFAEAIGITAQYLTDFRTGRVIVKNPRNFWKGVRTVYPKWESFLRGETDTPPSKEIVVNTEKETPSQKKEYSDSDLRLAGMIQNITMIMNSKYPAIKNTLYQIVHAFSQAVNDRKTVDAMTEIQKRDHLKIADMEEKIKRLEGYIENIKTQGCHTGTEVDG